MKDSTMKRMHLLALSTLVLLSFLHANEPWAQEFQAYEGKNAVREGEGGTKKTVDGVDFWSDGAPPYRFKLIGFITDRRHKTGLVGMISMSNLEGSIAEVAKKNGGDAVIQVSSEAETVGVVTNNYGTAQGTATTSGSTTNFNATGWSNGAAAKVQKQNSKFAVIKYMKDTSAPAGGASEAAKPEVPSTAPPEAPKQ
jgi:hypothetical protein